MFIGSHGCGRPGDVRLGKLQSPEILLENRLRPLETWPGKCNLTFLQLNCLRVFCRLNRTMQGKAQV